MDWKTSRWNHRMAETLESLPTERDLLQHIDDLVFKITDFHPVIP